MLEKKVSLAPVCENTPPPRNPSQVLQTSNEKV